MARDGRLLPLTWKALGYRFCWSWCQETLGTIYLTLCWWNHQMWKYLYVRCGSQDLAGWWQFSGATPKSHNATVIAIVGKFSGSMDKEWFFPVPWLLRKVEVGDEWLLSCLPLFSVNGITSLVSWSSGEENKKSRQIGDHSLKHLLSFLRADINMELKYFLSLQTKLYSLVVCMYVNSDNHKNL